MSFFDLFKDIGDMLGLSSSSYDTKPKSKRGDGSKSFSGSSKPRGKLILYDEEEGGVSNCPLVDYDEVVSFSACKACPYHEGPSLRNRFRSCLFDEKKHKVDEKPSPRWVKGSRGSSSQPSFPSSFGSRTPFPSSDQPFQRSLGSPSWRSSERSSPFSSRPLSQGSSRPSSSSSRPSSRLPFFGRNRRQPDPLESRAEEIYAATRDILNELRDIEMRLNRIRAKVSTISRVIEDRESGDHRF